MLTLRVKVTPNARRTEIVGWQGEVLKIKITAPPVDGRANEALREYLADLLGIKKADVILLRGHTSRDKTLSINAPEAVLAKFHTGEQGKLGV